MSPSSSVILFTMALWSCLNFWNVEIIFSCVIESPFFPPLAFSEAFSAILTLRMRRYFNGRLFRNQLQAGAPPSVLLLHVREIYTHGFCFYGENRVSCRFAAPFIRVCVNTWLTLYFFCCPLFPVVSSWAPLPLRHTTAQQTPGHWLKMREMYSTHYTRAVSLPLHATLLPSYRCLWWPKCNVQ